MKKKNLCLSGALLITLLLAACSTAARVERTPIPTLIPAALPAPSNASVGISFGEGQCRIYALDLIGAWVQAGKPESGPFNFFNQRGDKCQAAFAKDVLPLFTEPNIWYSGSIACAACHGKNTNLASAQMSLIDYAGIIAGSRRADNAPKGQDILADGQGSWEKSKLYTMILTKQMPMGRPATTSPKGPLVDVGSLVK